MRRLNNREIEKAIERKYFGEIWIMEKASGLSGVEKILKRGKCSVGMACKIGSILHIPIGKVWE